MRSAPLSENEQERLKALYDYDVLDTEAEKAFDDLTLLASQICDTPIALISLIDPNRQWFKAKVGLGADETPRDIAFCAHAILQREVFEVEDTLQDERFFDNPLVTNNPNIRFYAGAQLVNPEGHAIGTLCAISDQPKKLSTQQKSALETLSREVISQLELRQKIRQLKKADARKTDFLSNVSHELRTPLNAIISFSHILQEELNIETQPQPIRQYLDHLEFSGKRLLGIINSVLDITKIEEGKMELHPVPIDSQQFFYGLTGLLQARADEQNVYLNASIGENLPDAFLADESKLAQIILNVCQNAIKFTPADKQVSLQILVEAERLAVVVQDQGIGISKQDQQKLFDKFAQVGKTKQSEGTGLGLVITKGLVELMQGNIKLTSQLDVGTLVKIDLPLVATAQTPESKPSKEAGFRVGASILVVEDNLINQEVAKAVFQRMGIDIDLAESGEAAVQKVTEVHYDLVFMDLHLPGIDGIEASKRIKQFLPNLPIVALSADVFSEHIKDSQILDGYLSKPLESEALVQALKRFISADD